MKFNEKISNYDKLIILMRTGPKIIKGLFYKALFKKSKGLVLIGKHTRITHCNHIVIGNNSKIEDYCELQGLSEDGIIMGNKVTISRGVMIRPSSYYGGDIGKGCVIGDNSSIGPYGYVGCSGKISIGKSVMFGPKCSLFAENHIFNDKNELIKKQGVKQKGITIEDDCWIGSNVTILDGVCIGKGSIIGAGTLISKNIPPMSVVIDKRNKIIENR